MADMIVSVLNVSGGSNVTADTIAASAATGAVPCGGKDNKLAVLVMNGDDENIKVTIKAPTSGGGVRSSLGDLPVEIAAGKKTLIPLFDTARYKVLSGADKDRILFTLTDAANGALEEGELANITVIGVQL